MGDYKQLKVWEKAHQLCLSVMHETERFPTDERDGLAAQLRRSAISLASSIVEGSDRQSEGDMGRFLQIARGSLWAVHYQLLVARDLGFLAAEQWSELSARCDEIGRMLQGLLTHVRRQSRKGNGARDTQPARRKAVRAGA
ncbi:MAG TPA: four helix bundle protein [Gemmatimonadales bacterium]|jgi:four helix bundle protein